MSEAEIRALAAVQSERAILAARAAMRGWPNAASVEDAAETGAFAAGARAALLLTYGFAHAPSDGLAFAGALILAELEGRKRAELRAAMLEARAC